MWNIYSLEIECESVEHLLFCPFVQESLIANLLRLIKKMKPKSKHKSKGKSAKSEPTWDEREAEEESKKSDRDINKQLFPALAMPNNPNMRVCAVHIVSRNDLHLFENDFWNCWKVDNIKW